LGTGKDGKAVYLREIWPSNEEISRLIASSVEKTMFEKRYGDVFTGDDRWRAMPVPTGERYAWDPQNEYVKKPPYFEGMPAQPQPYGDIVDARALVVVGDSITTDHISPAGSIAKDSPAAKYLMERGIEARDFNSYGARRGNHEVMARGTFANTRLRNLLLPGVEGAVTRYLPTGEQMSIFDASMRYKKDGTPLLVFAGKEYGSGSSRDWAAKGPMLLGIRAVITESLERIHRSNLIGMGILPLEFSPGESLAGLGLTGEERYTIRGIDGLAPGATIEVEATSSGGATKRFKVKVRIDTPDEAEYYRHGGILHYVLRQIKG
ncbi:MAG: aconitate hydratase, partial [Candidatus Eremiobacteraeota bacterium]|nr:aconitate hydratase [Candidatus Eremiobacteraeota bacterium]MBV8355091.1 aconitate hydratase [Candidatus Eremiobacteraeota bacterium]